MFMIMFKIAIAFLSKKINYIFLDPFSMQFCATKNF